MAPSRTRRAAASPIGAVVGSTGSGKTELSLALAERLPLEIVVADSRQVYRGMDIGTAKPTAAQQAAVPHHLLDLVATDEPFSVATWVTEARELVPRIATRGRLPLVVGGSGLYVAAIVDGYALGPPTDPGTRAALREELATAGVAPLANRLRELDPGAALRIDMRNPRRVTRALERSAAAGGGAAPPLEAQPWSGRVALLGLGRPREVLNRRIDARARWLFANGLLEEVAALLEAGNDPDRAPLTSHGYAEAARYLAGEWSIEEAVSVTARRTRQYAKRQATWFRRDRRIVWLDASDASGDDPRLVDEALTLLRALLG